VSNSDTAFADEGNISEVDPNYSLLFGQGLGDEEAERRVGGRVIPRHDYYILDFEGGKAAFTNDGQPGISLMGRVQEGIEDTANAVVFGRQYFIVKPTKRVKTADGTVEVMRTPEEVEKAAREIRMTLRKLVRVFGAQHETPSDASEGGLNDYASQFRGLAIAAVSVRKARTGADGTAYPESNEIVLRSLAHPDEPVLDKKGAPTGETAIQEARRKIAEYNAKQARRGSTGTAREFGARPTATEFD